MVWLGITLLINSSQQHQKLNSPVQKCTKTDNNPHHLNQVQYYLWTVSIWAKQQIHTTAAVLAYIRLHTNKQKSGGEGIKVEQADFQSALFTDCAHHYQRMWWWWWWQLFPFMPGLWRMVLKNHSSPAPFFFFKWKSAHVHQFHSSHQDQSTVAQWDERLWMSITRWVVCEFTSLMDSHTMPG